jgi:hypothetical protein
MVDVTDVDDPAREQLALTLQAEVVPTVVVLAADGAILAKHEGILTPDLLRALLADW